MCLDLKIYEDYERRHSQSRSYTNYESEVIKVNFSVVSKRTGVTYEVFAVKNNDFLIFFNGAFTWQSMSQFRPIKKTEQERLGLTDTKEPMFKSQRKEQVIYP